MHKHNSPAHNFIRNFLRCGFTGWCMEIFFTALNSLRRRNMKLTGTTSLWMFPIYGCAVFLQPIFKLFQKRPLMVRGLTYMSLIFSIEFLSGQILRRWRLCPWDYSRSRYNVGKVIRLDYAPWWFGAGLLFEKILLRTQVKDETARISSRPTSYS